MTAAKTPAQPKAPSALDIERQCAVEMERGRRLGAEAAGELARARQAFDNAERARSDAMDALIRGEPDASERLSSLAQDMIAARRVMGEAQERSDAGRRVFEQAQARQRGVRTALVDELAQDAQQLVDAAVAARDALREPLEEYVRAYRAAERRWRDLYAGAHGKVEQIDTERGYYRDPDKLAREATCPELPLPADVVAKVLAVVPQPPVFRNGYAPDAATDDITVTPEQEGPVALFPGDEGYQRHHDQDTEPPGWPLGSTPPASVATLSKQALGRAVRS